MITAIDANVLFDVLTKEERHVDAAIDAIERSQREGVIVACEVVWAEVAAFFAHSNDHSVAMHNAAIAFDPIRVDAALTAGGMWRAYRKRGGKRRRVTSDFLIAAHAIHQADRLLTRDRGFTRRFFPDLIVLDPTGT